MARGRRIRSAHFLCSRSMIEALVVGKATYKLQMELLGVASHPHITDTSMPNGDQFLASYLICLPNEHGQVQMSSLRYRLQENSSLPWTT